MKFNDTGTLINWQLDDINIVEPLHSKEGGALVAESIFVYPILRSYLRHLALNTANIGQLLAIVRCHTKRTLQLPMKIIGAILMLLPIGKKSKITILKHLK
jgi:hypothetical protein